MRHKTIHWLLRGAGLAAVLATIPQAQALSSARDGAYLARLGLSYSIEGGVLPNTSESDWWYGCSPTAAGQIMGYYDRQGYNGQTYGNLVPGGVAEASAVGNPNAILKDTIASQGYQKDFYNADTYGYDTGGGSGYGYLESGDDRSSGIHAFNSLGDFMGTSQDSVGNKNGSTTFYYYGDGTLLTPDVLLAYGLQEYDGMYGVKQYIEYSGYSVNTIYTQVTDNVAGAGFSFADYKAEIDAGREVMLHVEGHSMTGIGYEGNNVLLYNTWGWGLDSMAWGGNYHGMNMWGVTVFEVAGGGSPVPEVASSVVLLGLAFGGLVTLRRRIA